MRLISKENENTYAHLSCEELRYKPLVSWKTITSVGSEHLDENIRVWDFCNMCSFLFTKKRLYRFYPKRLAEQSTLVKGCVPEKKFSFWGGLITNLSTRWYRPGARVRNRILSLCVFGPYQGQFCVWLRERTERPRYCNGGLFEMVHGVWFLPLKVLLLFRFSLQYFRVHLRRSLLLYRYLFNLNVVVSGALVTLQYTRVVKLSSRHDWSAHVVFGFSFYF